jgi:hypothetical protein
MYKLMGNSRLISITQLRRVEISILSQSNRVQTIMCNCLMSKVLENKNYICIRYDHIIQVSSMTYSSLNSSINA